jgi:hypothetical protein
LGATHIGRKDFKILDTFTSFIQIMNDVFKRSDVDGNLDGVSGIDDELTRLFSTPFLNRSFEIVYGLFLVDKAYPYEFEIIDVLIVYGKHDTWGIRGHVVIVGCLDVDLLVGKVLGEYSK